MTKQDILDGKAFVYTGNFTHLSFRYLKYDEPTQLICSGDRPETFILDKITDSWLVAFNRSFGRIPLLIQDCKLYEEIHDLMIAGGSKAITPYAIIKEWEALIA